MVYTITGPAVILSNGARMYSNAVVFKLGLSELFYLGRLAPARANPETLAPDPPAGDFGVEKVGLFHDALGGGPGDFDEPTVPGMKIRFVHWTVGVL